MGGFDDSEDKIDGRAAAVDEVDEGVDVDEGKDDKAAEPVDSAAVGIEVELDPSEIPVTPDENPLIIPSRRLTSEAISPNLPDRDTPSK